MAYHCLKVIPYDGDGQKKRQKPNFARWTKIWLLIFLALSEGFKIQAVEEAVGGGFTEIFRFDVVGHLKVGDGSGDL